MTAQTNYQLADFIAATSHRLHIRKAGYVIAIEERNGSRLLKTSRIHPGNDTLDCCLLDVAAEIKDAGREYKIEES